jgi:hypothetical protein
MAFSSIKILNIRSKSVGRNNEYFSNELFTLLDNNSDYLNQEKKLVFEDYGFDDPNKINISGSEFLKKITVSDFGNLYNTAVALSNIQLMYPAELSSIFETDKDKLKIIIEKDETKDKCSTYIISKKYYSKDGLLEDNDKPIYFDKEFDTTNYDLIDEKYKKQREQLSTDEFLVFLTDELINRSKISESAAEHMAETLINQAKKVREGDYAILVNSIGDEFPDTMEYYVRNNNIWVLSKDIDPNSFIKENDLLCNLDYNCIFDTKQDKCIGSEVTKDNLVNNALKEIINQFDKNYNISKEELNSKIPPNMIAIPFFSDMDDKVREFVEQIDANKSKIKMNQIKIYLSLTKKNYKKRK